MMWAKHGPFLSWFLLAGWVRSFPVDELEMEEDEEDI